MVTLPGLQPPGVVVQGGLGMASGLDSFDHVVPIMLGLALLGAGSGRVAECAPRGGRRVPTWGCGGQLTARTGARPPLSPSR